MKVTTKSDRRVGFTLIELMVVIIIIAALMAMTASAVMKFIAVQQTNNTQTTLTKVQSLLNAQWSAAKEQAMRDSIPASVSALNLQGTDVNASVRLRYIYVKLKMRQLFPMNFGEALTGGTIGSMSYLPHHNQALGKLGISPIVPPSPLPPLPAYVTYLNKFGITAGYVSSATYTPAPYESAACLLMALQRAQSGGASGASADLGGGGSSTTIPLPNGQSIPILADAWQRPIYFTRVPAGCPAVNGSPAVKGTPLVLSSPPALGGSPGINDPGDPQGYLNAKTWLSGPTAGNTMLFTQLTLQPPAGINAATGDPLSYNLVPMLASAGMRQKQFPYLSDPVWFSMTQTYDNNNLFSNP